MLFYVKIFKAFRYKRKKFFFTTYYIYLTFLLCIFLICCIFKSFHVPFNIQSFVFKFLVFKNVYMN